MKRTFVSFDIFDTCLIRRCGEPHKIWDLMAEELFDKDDVRGRLSFVGNRRVAERKLLEINPYPTFRDIYNALDVTQWGFETDRVMQLELDMEERELFPNPQMKKIVDQYRLDGFEINFISDMYLPTEFLKRILIKFDFCRKNEKVYVSAECRASKHMGSLFDFVLKSSSTKGCQWIHYGDNENSDYFKPKLKGIDARLVRNSNFTVAEKSWIDDAKFYKSKNEIELWAGLCRLCRLNLPSLERCERAVDLIASLYIPYVNWVLKEAEKKQIKTLYFLARDAHIFLEIAKQLKKKFADLELKYLKLSRKSLYACVFYEVNSYEMKLTIGQCVPQSVETAVKYIGLDWDELSEQTKSVYKSSYALTSVKKASLFSETLIKNDKDVIKRRSKDLRTYFLRYLKQEGVLDQKSKSVVDLGWAGSGRCIINYILKQEGFPSMPAFYWGSCLNLMYGKSEDELFVFQKQYDLAEYSHGAILFLEQYASINENGSTIGYREELGVVTPIEKATNSVDEELVCLNENAVKLVSSMLGTIKDDSLYDIFLCCGLKQLQKIQDSPTKADLKLFEDIETENFGEVIKLVQPLTIKNFLALLVWGYPATPQWQMAAIKKTFGPFSGFFQMLYKFTSKTTVAHLLRKWWDQ